MRGSGRRLANIEDAQAKLVGYEFRLECEA